MPYGKDFLDALDEMLFEDDSHTSKRVRNMCSKCHSLDATTFGQGDGSNWAILNGCNSCVRTQIIGWDEGTKKYTDIGL